MQKEKKHEMDTMLKKSQKKILAGEVRTSSLVFSKERQLETRRQQKQSKAIKVMEDISIYLKLHNIYFQTDRSEGIPRITIVFKNCDRCPGHITEGCIYFYDDCMEARVYYSEMGANMCKQAENLSDLYRLMNFLHAMLWPCVTDGMEDALYKSQHLISPRFYVTEDGKSDITAATVIPYTHFELDMLEIEDFITAALPDLLDSLSVPVFLLLAGNISIDEAIRMVESEILGKGGKE